jgi:hypothetical protein
MCRVKNPRWAFSNKGADAEAIASLALHFGNVPHHKSLPIVKHEANFITNQTYVDHKVYLCLLLSSVRVLTHISRHIFPAVLED